MKRIIFMLIVLSVSISAQTKDSVDIRAIVQKQIDAALERDRLEQAKRDSLASAKVMFGPERDLNDEKVEFWGPMPEFIGPLEAVVVAAKDNFPVSKDSLALAKQQAMQKIVSTPLITSKENPKGSSDFMWKFYLLGGVSVAAFAFVFIRRLLAKRSAEPGNKIKNNIRIIREENVIKREQPQLTMLRSKLVNSSVILNNHGKPLSAVAKELNISQGEIILAAKIKSYELAKEDNGNWYLN